MTDRKLNRVHELAHQLYSFQETQSSDAINPSVAKLINYIRSRDLEPPPSAKFQKYPPNWCLSKGILSKAVREFRDLIPKLEKDGWISPILHSRWHGLRTHSNKPQGNPMESSAVLEDFWRKVQTVLEVFDIPRVLVSLRELAEGKEVMLNDQTTIQSLQGLGRQTSFPNQEYYVKALSSLLTWFVCHVQFREAHDHDNLWGTMAILDGPNGYNQRLITANGTFTADGMYLELIGEGGLCVSTPHPTILVPMEKKPLEVTNVNVNHIAEYIQSGKAKSILAVQSFFGWLRLSIHCLCLYMEADENLELIELCSQQELPVILQTTKFYSPVQDTSQAKEILKPAGISAFERSKRQFMLQKISLPHRLPNCGVIHHGQSVSQLGQESKGSVGVFLSPSGTEKNIYALTAYHVLPMNQINEPRVITPAGLDVSSRLYWAMKDNVPNNERIAALLDQREDPCGVVEYGNIGSNANGWRTDFALVNLHDGFEGKNGIWHEYGDLNEIRAATEDYLFDSSGTNRILGAHDPSAGEICYKDGATTGITRGLIGPSEALQFMPGLAEIAAEDSPGVAIVKLLTWHQMDEKDGNVCAEGDSGSSIFVPAPERGGWEWVGQLVSMMRLKGDNVGLVAPAGQVFKSLEEDTGFTWELAP